MRIERQAATAAGPVMRRGGRRRAVGSVWWTIAPAEMGGSRRGPAVDAGRLRRVRRGYGDWVLLGAVAMLVALGIVMVLDVTYFYGQERYGNALLFFWRHVVAVAAGAAAFVMAARLPLGLYRRAAVPAIACALLALVLVLTPLGAAHAGARRWFLVGGMSLQPSEWAKLAVVVYLARYFARRRDRRDDFRRGMLPPLLTMGAVGTLLLCEPDFGAAVLLGGVFVAMALVAGVPARQLVVLHAAALPVGVLVALSAEYRWGRILSFLDPWDDPRNSGFQLVQSLIAFGSGGFAGLGLGESRQKMFYLPAAHTDFIYSVVGEELGLLGAVAVLVLFAVVGWRGTRIAWRHPDPFARLLATGLTTLLALQAGVNMAVVLGLIPTKGLPLPFVSYGGSAMISALLAVGMLYGLSRDTS
jgi:cell division protein FtsW